MLGAHRQSGNVMAGVESTLNLNLKNNVIIILKKILWKENISSCNAGDPGLIPGLGRSAGEGIVYLLQYSWASLMAQLVKNPPTIQETWVGSLGCQDPLDKGKATDSSILAWRITDTTEWLSFSFFIISTDHIKCSVMSDSLQPHGL